jgi:cytochrome c oxidase assembly protein subunit 15
MGQSNYQYGVMSYDARLSIHVLHRIGAFITFILLGSLSYMVVRRAIGTTMRRLGIALGGLLMLQCCLGVINVVAYLPLLNAVAHNFVAANLLMLLVVFIYQLYQRRDYSRSSQKINQSLTAHTNSITVKV